MAPGTTEANRRARPFDRAGQAAGELVRETAGLLTMASASKTRAVAAAATAGDVGEHPALERHREAGGLRVAQEE